MHVYLTLSSRLVQLIDTVRYCFKTVDSSLLKSEKMSKPFFHKKKMFLILFTSEKVAYIDYVYKADNLMQNDWMWFQNLTSVQGIFTVIHMLMMYFFVKLLET